MSKLIEALKRKYKTPADAVRALGLDPKLLEEEFDVRNNPLPYKPYRLRLAGDAEPSLTAERCAEALKLLIRELGADEEEALRDLLDEAISSGNLHQWAAEDSRHRGYDRRGLGRDNPARFPGEPEPGGGLADILRQDAEDRRREGVRRAHDARARLAADALPSSGVAGFNQRFPHARQIGQF